MINKDQYNADDFSQSSYFLNIESKNTSVPSHPFVFVFSHPFFYTILLS